MKVLYIPNGPVNLTTLFPGVDFSLLASYYIEMKDADDNVIATLPNNLMEGCITCSDDKIRLRFINYDGTIDGMNFKLITNEHETKSDTMQNMLPYPLSKKSHSINRFNVKANNTLTLYNKDYEEKDNAWINELVDSPQCWMEWAGGQGQLPAYIPVVIADVKILNVKEEERFLNEVVIQVSLSNSKYLIRS